MKLFFFPLIVFLLLRASPSITTTTQDYERTVYEVYHFLRLQRPTMPSKNEPEVIRFPVLDEVHPCKTYSFNCHRERLKEQSKQLETYLSKAITYLSEESEITFYSQKLKTLNRLRQQKVLPSENRALMISAQNLTVRDGRLAFEVDGWSENLDIYGKDALVKDVSYNFPPESCKTDWLGAFFRVSCALRASSYHPVDIGVGSITPPKRVHWQRNMPSSLLEIKQRRENMIRFKRSLNIPTYERSKKLFYDKSDSGFEIYKKLWLARGDDLLREHKKITQVARELDELGAGLSEVLKWGMYANEHKDALQKAILQLGAELNTSGKQAPVLLMLPLEDETKHIKYVLEGVIDQAIFESMEYKTLKLAFPGFKTPPNYNVRFYGPVFRIEMEKMPERIYQTHVIICGKKCCQSNVITKSAIGQSN